MKKYIYLTIFTLITIGCGGGSVNTDTTEEPSSSSNKIYKPTEKAYDINSSNQIVKVANTSDSNITLNVDTPKDIYVVVTSHFNNQNISITSPSATLDVVPDSKLIANNTNRNYNKIPKSVLEFRKNVSNLLRNNSSNAGKISKKPKLINNVNEGDAFTFCTDMDSNYNCTNYINATAKKVVRAISTKQGDRDLIVWVEDDEYNNGGIISGGTITQNMVDKLANTFLKNSDNNKYDDDIYDWDTNIYGKEWGSDAQSINSNLIGESDTINILIFNANSRGLAGYFYPKDNFKKSYIPASNEKIMFYVNSELYSKNEGETFTTLAHEFQHMIHFYRRNVNNIEDSTWFDEMMSEATEDLVATKLKLKGPRNVDYRDGTAGNSHNTGGRYPKFNEYNYLSLTNWGSGATPYSKVSSFGAFLLRNYGGAKILHDLMYSKSSNEEAILDATGVSRFETLLNKWAEAVILSDVDDLNSSKPRYNFGDFKETTYDGITYKLGSINFFNYYPMPTMSSSKTINKDANLYYKVGNSLSGELKINVNIEKGGDVIIIAK